MDKETLSNYGWIVICVLVLAVMIALATPFGNFIAQGFKSIYEGFGLTSNNALGVVIPGANGPSGGNQEQTPSPTVKFYQPYKTTIDGDDVEYVFYEDGSVAIYNNTTLTGEILEAGTCTYEEGSMTLYEEQGTINSDGSQLTFISENESQVLTLVPTNVEYVEYNTIYNAQIDVFDAGVLFYEDGSLALYSDGYKYEVIEYIEYRENEIFVPPYYSLQEIIPVHPSGDKFILMDTIFIVSNIKEETSQTTPLKFNQPYSAVIDDFELEVIFHEDGSSELYEVINGNHYYPYACAKHTSIYNGKEVWSQTLEANLVVSDDGTSFILLENEWYGETTFTLKNVTTSEISFDTRYGLQVPDQPELKELYFINISSDYIMTLTEEGSVAFEIQLTDHGYYMLGTFDDGEIVKIIKYPTGIEILFSGNAYGIIK